MTAEKRKNWMLEPDLLAQQSGSGLQPGMALGDDGAPYWADTGEKIQVVPRPNVLPFASTPDGVQLAMPKIADILGNLGGGPAPRGATAAGIPVQLSKQAGGVKGLGEAEQLLESGRGGEAWKASRDWKNGVAGVYRSPEGVNRIDVPDYGMRVARGQLSDMAKAVHSNGTSTLTPALYQHARPLADVVESENFAHVPGLNDWRIVGYPRKDLASEWGFADAGNKVIGIASDAPHSGGPLSFDRGRVVNTVSHEMQHAVDAEGRAAGLPIFTTGSSPDYWGSLQGYTDHLAKLPMTAQSGALLDYLRGVQNTRNPTFTMYANNLGETLARVAGETAAMPGADRAAWLAQTPNERMRGLRSSPVAPWATHSMSGGGDLDRAVSAATGANQDPSIMYPFFPKARLDVD